MNSYNKNIKTSSKNTFRDLPHYLKVFQTYLGRRMYYVFGLTLFAVVSEGVGIIMLLPLLQSLGSVEGDDSSIPQMDGLLSYLHGMLAVFNMQDSVVAVLFIITIAFAMKGVLTFGAMGYSGYLRGQLLRELKGRLFDLYGSMTYDYYSSRDTGHFINIINQQIVRSLVCFNSLTQLGAQAIYAIIYVALALVVAWKFGLMAITVSLVLLVLFRSLNIYVRQLSRKAANENGLLTKLLIQTIHAFKYLTATGQASHVRGTVAASINRLTGYQIRTDIASSFTSAVREPIAVVCIMLIVLVQIVYIHQPLTPILVSILLFHRGLNATLSIQHYWQKTLESIGSMEIVHQEFANQYLHQERAGNQALVTLSKEICFKDVYFSYGSNTAQVIKGVSLEIPVRTSVAMVGESGAGKSTLVDLLTLILKPQRGEILIDGISGNQINLPSWRRQIGYVSQEAVIFDDTIANNISLWGGDILKDKGLFKRVQEAARQAHIAHFIETLPDGYHTMVGDRGLRLSGGQRQRLFIARELFRKPNLLLLDEATSALDSESESAIQASIDELKGQITVVMIAHRLSTIRNVDRVYVFDQGRLVEQGTYQELRDAKGSRFGKLIARQTL
jgi:ABC-type multidrug transport system fused ATPase/permease subunit